MTDLIYALRLDPFQLFILLFTIVSWIFEFFSIFTFGLSYRKHSLITYLTLKHGDGVLLSGFIVQLITHGLQKVSLWST